MEITIKELNNKHLVFNTLKTNFSNVQSAIKELENKLLDQNAFKEDRKKNEEIINRKRTGLKAKDQHIH